MINRSVILKLSNFYATLSVVRYATKVEHARERDITNAHTGHHPSIFTDFSRD